MERRTNRSATSCREGEREVGWGFYFLALGGFDRALIRGSAVADSVYTYLWDEVAGLALPYVPISTYTRSYPTIRPSSSTFIRIIPPFTTHSAQYSIWKGSLQHAPRRCGRFFFLYTYFLAFYFQIWEWEISIAELRIYYSYHSGAWLG